MFPTVGVMCTQKFEKFINVILFGTLSAWRLIFSWNFCEKNIKYFFSELNVACTWKNSWFPQIKGKLKTKFIGLGFWGWSCPARKAEVILAPAGPWDAFWGGMGISRNFMLPPKLGYWTSLHRSKAPKSTRQNIKRSESSPVRRIIIILSRCKILNWLARQEKKITYASKKVKPVWSSMVPPLY